MERADTLSALVARLRGSEIRQTTPYPTGREVRVRIPIEDARVSVNALLFCRTPNQLTSERTAEGPPDGDQEAGVWTGADDEVLAARLLDWAVIVSEDLDPDPFFSPRDFVTRLMRGDLVWPPEVDIGENREALVQVLERVITSAMEAPHMVLTVRIAAGDVDLRHDLFMGTFDSVVVSRHEDSVLSAAVFPSSDVVSRLLDLTGLSVRLTGERIQPTGQSVRVRISFDDPLGGLYVGGLDWRETDDGRMLSNGQGSEECSAVSLSHQLFALLPVGM